MADARLCRLCRERPVPAYRVAHRDYRCNPCRCRFPSQRAAAQRHNNTPRGREKHRLRARKRNPKRIFIGHTYHSVAASAEQAQRINALVKELAVGFKQRQQGRKETEDHPA